MLDSNEKRILLIVAIVSLVTWLISLLGGRAADLDGRASAVSALFSAAGLIGLLATLYLQRKELMLQRRELRLTRKELSLTREEVMKSAKAQKKSERALASQAISLTFAARLNSVSAMLTFYENRYSSLFGIAGQSAEDERKTADLLREKYRMSLEALDNELTFSNLSRSFSPSFALITMCQLVKARIANELARSKRSLNRQFTLQSLYLSIQQEILATVQSISGVPQKVGTVIALLTELMPGLEVQEGPATNQIDALPERYTRFLGLLDHLKAAAELAAEGERESFG